MEHSPETLGTPSTARPSHSHDDASRPTQYGMLEDLEAYWRALRGKNRLPVRTEVNPARIDNALPHSFIAERVAPGVLRFRVAGQQLATYLGMDARGMPLSVFFRPESRDRLAEEMERVFQDPAIVAIDLFTPRSLLRRSVRGRLLVLPLMGGDGSVSRALGAIELEDGRHGDSVRRFDICPDRPVRHERILGESQGSARPRLAALPGHGLLAGMPGVARSARSCRLRLVVSND